MDANDAERRRWNDARWATLWPKRERLTTEVTGYLLDAAALQPGETVLDVGCGGGMTSLAAAQAVGFEGSVVGADLSEPLVALASSRARDAGVENVSFRAVDMQTDKVAGAPFAVVISQFGVMFFDEPVTAFANIRAHLRPGGRIVFACWQEAEKNPWIFASAIAEWVPPPPEPEPGKSPSGPFTLADPERTTAILRTAGFLDVRRTLHDITVDAPPDSVVDDDHLIEIGVAEEHLAAAQAAVDAHMAQFAVTAEVSRFPLRFQVYEATSEDRGGWDLG